MTESEEVEHLLPKKYICEKQASKIYGMSIHWFQRERWKGTGPPYVKVGRSVRYRVEEIEEYFQSIDR